MKNVELFRDLMIFRGLRFPHKVQKVTHIVITEGEISCIVDFHSYSLKAPSMAMFLPGQVIESLEVNDEFAGFGMYMSQEFTDSLDITVGLQEKIALRTTHFYTISQSVVNSFISLYNQVESVLGQDDNPYREIIIKHLFSAHYYGLGYYIHGGMQKQTSVMTLQQEACERFISLVADNFKSHRDIGFYADRLCITNKYLSALLKQETGMTALEWIEKYVILYAKSCLSSTSMTIQEISDDLDFPSQSVFGKYFKRVEGMSPKAYRKSLENASVSR